jgi:hypothetical protein
MRCYVNFPRSAVTARSPADHGWDFITKRCHCIWDLPTLLPTAADLVSPAQTRSCSSISSSGSAQAIGGGLQGRPRPSSIFRIASMQFTPQRPTESSRLRSALPSRRASDCAIGVKGRVQSRAPLGRHGHNVVQIPRPLASFRGRICTVHGHKSH